MKINRVIAIPLKGVGCRFSLDVPICVYQSDKTADITKPNYYESFEILEPITVLRFNIRKNTNKHLFQSYGNQRTVKATGGERNNW